MPVNKRRLKAVDNKNDIFAQTSFLFGGNAGFIEELYVKYQENPASLSEDWQTFFANLQDDPTDIAANARGASWKRGDWPKAESGELVSALDGDWSALEAELKAKLPGKGGGLSQDEVRAATLDSIRAIMLIRAYRVRGNLHANLDPLGLEKHPPDAELQPETYGFSESDMDRPIFLDNVLGLETATMREIIDIVQRTYCSTIGFEFMHISDPEEKGWMQARIEGRGKEVSFTPEGKKAILHKLLEAEGFEKFLDVKYTGTKRFGLDGGEALVPALEQIIKRGGNLGVEEIVIGMPHRGRLNVLAQVMGKPMRAILNEFKGGSANPDDIDGSGDVKYHLGASSDRSFDGNDVHLSLTANPSHLEIVDPVVLGKVRAKQEQFTDSERIKALPLLLHGDAAFSGQGVVAECFGLSGLKGHKTGGSFHFIVNNQIGFTTSPSNSRSSPFPSDMAKMIGAPIFHVNGDDPEAVVFAVKVATEFRQEFHKPVVVDMFCYRRFGHNEGDEPSFTQPLMYQKIRSHPTTATLYCEQLVKEGVVTEAEIEKMKADIRAMLEEEFELANEFKPNKADWLDGAWSGLYKTQLTDDPRRADTGVDEDKLKELGHKLTEVPDGFNIHKTLGRVIAGRRKMIDEDIGLDWSMGEALAFASLLTEGYSVRLSGQDCERGTFSQRHSVFNDQKTAETYTPLNNLSDDQKHYEVINSMLSEEAVLGFEYGYSLAEPNCLTLWEAQFGDFANGAQVLFDQFISSGELKWLRMSGLVCLLPHGYEGQGPEHSSARLERFLQMCAEDNMQVANCTTPANYFHILRRQLHRDFRKPLIMMTPKSILRHKRATSKLKDLGSHSCFHRVLWDDAQVEGSDLVDLVEDRKIRRVVMCSGKVYYDLLEEREKRGINDIYLLRIEQLYPFPKTALKVELERFKTAEMVWCQEEPKNMGGWTFVEPYIEETLISIDAKQSRPRYAGRAAAAATATGLMSKHIAQLEAFLEEALGE